MTATISRSAYARTAMPVSPCPITLGRQPGSSAKSLSCRGTQLVRRWGMRLTLQPNGRLAHGQGHSYLVALPHDATAILDLIGDKGWHLTIRRQDGRVIDRGLFWHPR